MFPSVAKSGLGIMPGSHDGHVVVGVVGLQSPYNSGTVIDTKLVAAVNI